MYVALSVAPEALAGPTKIGVVLTPAEAEELGVDPPLVAAVGAGAVLFKLGTSDDELPSVVGLKVVDGEVFVDDQVAPLSVEGAELLLQAAKIPLDEKELSWIADDLHALVVTQKLPVDYVDLVDVLDDLALSLSESAL